MAELITRKDGVDPYPEVLLRGETFLSIMQSINFHEFESVVDEWLVESGIGTVDPKEWYPRQEWLNLLKKLEDRSGSTTNQVSIGMKVIENVVLPEEVRIDTVYDAISMLVTVYVNNQQNLPTGDMGYEVRQVDDTHYEILDTNPYLFNVNYGYIWGILKRFLPHDFTLEHEFMNPEEPEMGGVIFKVSLN